VGRPDLVLASRSPRRLRLLEAAGVPFRLGAPPDVDETPPPGCSPPEGARAVAERKLRAALEVEREGVVLCADTVVFLGEHVLGKPRDAADARRMLALLSGRTHEVATAVALGCGQRLASGVDVARVTFRTLSDEEIAAYVATGEPLDKAGAYAIQGGAAGFVQRLEGSRDTVVGLPVALVRTLRRRLEGGGLESGGPEGR